MVVPDIDGRVCQDFAVAVPAAVGRRTAAGRVISADLAEDLVLPVLPQVEVRVALAVTGGEAETPYPVDLNKVQVKLGNKERRRSRQHRQYEKNKELFEH